MKKSSKAKNARAASSAVPTMTDEDTYFATK